MSQKRDKTGKIKDSLLQRFRSWRLNRLIRKGKLPRGRTTAGEAAEALKMGAPKNALEMWGFLSARITHASGAVEDLGLISIQKITTAFRDYLVDSLQNSATNPLSNFKFHGCGTGTTAEENTQTALVTEVGSRVEGSQTEGATANIYKTVATISFTDAYAITEHGVFSASSNGTLMDRSLFSAINVVSGDSIQFTYEATFNAEASGGVWDGYTQKIARHSHFRRPCRQACSNMLVFRAEGFIRFTRSREVERWSSARASGLYGRLQ
jgi:hypothetical protein